MYYNEQYCMKLFILFLCIKSIQQKVRELMINYLNKKLLRWKELIIWTKESVK